MVKSPQESSEHSSFHVNAAKISDRGMHGVDMALLMRLLSSPVKRQTLKHYALFLAHMYQFERALHARATS